MLWCLGYVDAALADVGEALRSAREVGQAATLMYALWWTSWTQLFCGNYAAVIAQCDEVITLGDEKNASQWKGAAMCNQGCALALMGKPAEAVKMIMAGVAVMRTTGSTFSTPHYMSALAWAHAELGDFDGAWRSIGEAMAGVEATKERWFEAEVHRIAGEIALKSPKRQATKAEAYFEHALAIARQQQAKSWELRTGMSISRLLRDQGRWNEAHNLLAPVYGWFTEGFDTPDLKKSKALLDELAH